MLLGAHHSSSNRTRAMRCRPIPFSLATSCLTSCCLAQFSAYTNGQILISAGDRPLVTFNAVLLDDMSKSQQQAQEDAMAAAAAMAMATTELEYRVELLNRMVAGCYDKCAAKP